MRRPRNKAWTREASQDRVKAGIDGEAKTRRLLEDLGFVCIERIETGFKVIRGPRGQIVHAFPMGKVAGDFRAVDPTSGRSVVVEVKNRKDGVLSLSDFEDHQAGFLTQHLQAGGLSLVVLVCPAGCVCVPWPIPGLRKGHPLRHADLLPLSVRKVPSCARTGPSATDRIGGVHLVPDDFLTAVI